jgi:hypothetical protein
VNHYVVNTLRGTLVHAYPMLVKEAKIVLGDGITGFRPIFSGRTPSQEDADKKQHKRKSFTHHKFHFSSFNGITV